MKLEGTYEWIYGNEVFQSYIVASDRRHVWASGRLGMSLGCNLTTTEPLLTSKGAGKSVLCASIIDRFGWLEGDPASDLSEDEPVILYYFFLYTEGADQLPAMIASLIEQLLQTGINLEKGHKILDREYYKNKRSAHTLWRAFMDMTTGFPTRIFAIIDGLDECQEDERTTFLKLVTQSDVEARFLVASRPEADIERVLQHHASFQCLNVDTRSDIEFYIDTMIHDYGVKQGHKTGMQAVLENHREAIYKKVKETTGGMIRYAALMFDELSNHTGDQTSFNCHQAFKRCMTACGIDSRAIRNPESSGKLLCSFSCHQSTRATCAVHRHISHAPTPSS